MRSNVYQDFDAFAASVRNVDSEMLLRNPKRRVWSTSSVDLGSIELQFGNLGSGNIAQGEMRSDGYMIYLPLTNAVEYKANATVLPRKSFAILGPECEFCISTEVEHEWCVAFVPTEMFDFHPTASPSKSCRVTHSKRQAAEQFRSTLLHVCTASALSAEFEKSPAATQAAAEVRRIAKSIIAGERTVEMTRDGRPKVPRDLIIRRAMDLLDERAENLPSVGELALAANVSERTLRTAFNEYFAIGPAQYLRLRHLHLIRRALKAADPEQGVSHILVEHGEWAFGRFAKRYHRLFGELPSETLRRTRK